MSKLSGVEKAEAADKGLYCYCKGPNTGGPMIACDKCEEWFHGECIGLSPGFTVGDVELFLCGCSLKNEKAIRYKKRRASMALRGSAVAGANDAAASTAEGEASTSKETPVNDGSEKKSVEKRGRMTRTNKKAAVDSPKPGRV
ncbi:Set1 complex component spp1 [Aphelenchoides avenae]|nr:Set1 complex component spp1 [Aphelenchus avenae]